MCTNFGSISSCIFVKDLYRTVIESGKEISMTKINDFQLLNFFEKISVFDFLVVLDTFLVCSRLFIFLLWASLRIACAIYVPFFESVQFCFLPTGLRPFLWTWVLLMMAAICILLQNIYCKSCFFVLFLQSFFIFRGCSFTINLFFTF